MILSLSFVIVVPMHTLPFSFPGVGVVGIARRGLVLLAVLLRLAPELSANGQPIEVTFVGPSLDRWLYPHNATPGSRPTAPVFGTLGDDSGVDARHGQFLLAFDLASRVPTNFGPSRYLIQRCRVSVTVSRDRSFALDPTTDGPATYLPTNHQDHVPDSDLGRPIEMFGVGFRNGFTAGTFLEDSPFGSAAVGERNAFATGFDESGLLIDVSNNVGKTNTSIPSFQAHPFAVGNSASVAAGETVPAGSTVDFDMNLADPLVAQYLQEACHTGKLMLMLTSLQTSGFGGQPAWAEFYTKESALGNPPSLSLSLIALSPEDSDSDQLPDDWERHFHGSLSGGASDDPDGDGLSDLAEWQAGTDPKNPTDTFQVQRVQAAGEDSHRLRFRYSPSRRYELASSSDLHAWGISPDAVIRHELGSAWASWLLPSKVSTGARFFQIKATPVTALQP